MKQHNHQVSGWISPIIQHDGLLKPGKADAFAYQLRNLRRRRRQWIWIHRPGYFHHPAAVYVNAYSARILLEASLSDGNAVPLYDGSFAI